jgi:hypothetical protein
MTPNELPAPGIQVAWRFRTDSLLRDWGQVMALRQSAQQFNGRLLRTAPLVTELAASYPALRDAVKVVNVLIANVGLADDVLGRLAIPGELLEEVE